MEIRPTRKGLELLGVTLLLPGLVCGVLLGRVHLTAGLVLSAIWLGLTLLLVRFRFAVQRAIVEQGVLTVEWGTAFPGRVVMPLGCHAALRWFRTPAMRALGCCVLLLESPGGRVMLWAVSKEAALGLAALLRGEEQP